MDRIKNHNYNSASDKIYLFELIILTSSAVHRALLEVFLLNLFSVIKDKDNKLEIYPEDYPEFKYYISDEHTVFKGMYISAEYLASYVKFIDKIRSEFPNLHIITKELLVFDLNNGEYKLSSDVRYLNDSESMDDTVRLFHKYTSKYQKLFNEKYSDLNKYALNLFDKTHKIHKELLDIISKDFNDEYKVKVKVSHKNFQDVFSS